MGFRAGLLMGLVLIVGSFILAIYALPSASGGLGLGTFLFVPTVGGLCALVLIVGLIAGISRNDEWPGVIVGGIIGLYLVAIFQAISAFV